MGILASIFDKPWEEGILLHEYLTAQLLGGDYPEIPWKKAFALVPRKMMNGEVVWFKTVYKRKHILSRRTEYGTILDVVQNKPMEE